jgi:hypothetical protein
VIAESRTWQRRHGGNLIHLYPFVLFAQRGLRERLERMEAYHALRPFWRRFRRSRFELTVGEATLDLSSQEIVELFQMWLMRVRA